MRRMSVKILLVVVALVVISAVVATKVNATSTTGPISVTQGTATGTGTGVNPISVTSSDTNTTTNTTETPSTTLNVVQTNTASSNYDNNTKLPDTGDASDYAIFMLIAVGVVAAIYAYRRYTNYNI